MEEGVIVLPSYTGIQILKNHIISFVSLKTFDPIFNCDRLVSKLFNFFINLLYIVLSLKIPDTYLC